MEGYLGLFLSALLVAIGKAGRYAVVILAAQGLL
jgi:membrane protein YqaA with SNARE-associated domain